MSEENENIRFSSYEQVAMKPDEKEEVYERLVGSMTGEKSRKNRWIPALLTAALVTVYPRGRIRSDEHRDHKPHSLPRRGGQRGTGENLHRSG
ncbi:hypothetical protein [Rossellomorea marisflavi]|uniref:hypothetical protein n=1 Tax=Rossellomorea marisflavi TaxID=189381 RepID=UPI003FA0F809